jgi:hypothetical protein
MRDVEFAREVIQVARDDVQQVYLRVTGILGLAIIFVTQLPFDRLLQLPVWTRWTLAAGLASAVTSAALYFHYLSKVHLARLDMARSIRDGRPAEVEEIWAGTGSVWTRHGWAFKYGGRFLVLSVALLGLTLTVLLDLVP